MFLFSRHALSYCVSTANHFLINELVSKFNFKLAVKTKHIFQRMVSRYLIAMGVKDSWRSSDSDVYLFLIAVSNP